MTYSQIAVAAAIIAIIIDLTVSSQPLLKRRAFWASYAIILPFQLLTNWWLTSNEIVMYSDTEIIGQRLAGAPIEDLLFGFSMILLTISAWEFFKDRLNKKKVS
jgi:lycopene cyclase domain-containing protein